MKKNTNLYNITLKELAHNIVVVCPKCDRKALVKSSSIEVPAPTTTVNISCVSCGYHKKLNPITSSGPFSWDGITPSAFGSFGGDVDPYFLFPLWYKTLIGENVLWAYNLAHLELLEKHIKADLRTRNGLENRNKSVASRLPKWMTSRKKRAAVLKKINALKNK